MIDNESRLKSPSLGSSSLYRSDNRSHLSLAGLFKYQLCDRLSDIQRPQLSSVNVFSHNRSGFLRVNITLRSTSGVTKGRPSVYSTINNQPHLHHVPCSPSKHYPTLKHTLLHSLRTQGNGGYHISSRQLETQSGRYGSKIMIVRLERWVMWVSRTGMAEVTPLRKM